MMDADEKEIFRYLIAEPARFVAAAAICRHAGGKHKHRESPDWAKPALLRMLERDILETDAIGAYRLKPIPVVPSANTRHWVSPQIAELLRRSGKKFDSMIQQKDDPEAYYDSL